MTAGAGGMRVLYDLRGAQSRHFSERGIPRYIGNHVASLAGRRDVAELHALVDPDRPMPNALASMASRGWALAPEAAGMLLDTREPLVHHVSSPFELDLSLRDLVPPALRDLRVARVVTFYDAIPHVFSRMPSWIGRLWDARAEVLRSADLVLAISEHTAADAVESLGIDAGRVRVIGAGVPHVDPRALAGAARPPDVDGVDAGYILYTGGANDERKNLLRLVRAYARLDPHLRRAHQLVIASKI